MLTYWIIIVLYAEKVVCLAWGGGWKRDIFDIDLFIYLTETLGPMLFDIFEKNQNFIFWKWGIIMDYHGSYLWIVFNLYTSMQVLICNSFFFLWTFYYYYYYILYNNLVYVCCYISSLSSLPLFPNVCFFFFPNVGKILGLLPGCGVYSRYFSQFDCDLLFFFF